MWLCNAEIGNVIKDSGKTNNNKRNYNKTRKLGLPYNPKLKDRAKELRQAGNLSEVIFWTEVKKNQFHDIDFKLTYQSQLPIIYTAFLLSNILLLFIKIS